MVFTHLNIPDELSGGPANHLWDSLCYGESVYHTEHHTRMETSIIPRLLRSFSVASCFCTYTTEALKEPCGWGLGSQQLIHDVFLPYLLIGCQLSVKDMVCPQAL